MRLPMLPVDKANHAIYGWACGAAGRLLAVTLGAPQYQVHAALGAAATFGALKEAIDWYRNRRAAALGQSAPHSVEFGDFFATVLGGAGAAVVGQ